MKKIRKFWEIIKSDNGRNALAEMFIYGALVCLVLVLVVCISMVPRLFLPFAGFILLSLMIGYLIVSTNKPKE